MFRPYVPDGKVLTDFVFANDRVSIIQGPVGSGSSSGLIGRMRRHAVEQRPNSEGVRQTKWVVMRPTYKDLNRTFVDTYRFWMQTGKVTPDLVGNGPITHHIKPDMACAQLGDGTKLDCQVIFLAVLPDEPPAYYQMLDSWEATGFVINEAQEYHGKTAIDKIMGRALQGRYPPAMDGGPTWFGCLMDLNAPPQGHWLPYMRGDVEMPQEWTQDKRREYEQPDDWKFYVQPPGLIEKHDTQGKMIGYQENPEAENARYRQVPYLKQIQAKSRSYIETYVMNRVGMMRKGDPVFETFSVERNVKNGMKAIPGIPLVVGMDAARNPFATVWQNVRGSWRCLSELGMQKVSASTFGPALKRHLLMKYPENMSETSQGVMQGANFWCDPSATRKGDGTDDSFYSVLRGMGIMCQVAPGNNHWEMRRGAMENSMLRMTPDGDMGMLIDGDACPTVKNALYSGYVLGEDNTPDKKKSGVYADAADSCQYALLGGGEGAAVIGRSNKVNAPVSYARPGRSSRRSR